MPAPSAWQVGIKGEEVAHFTPSTRPAGDDLAKKRGFSTREAISDHRLGGGDSLSPEKEEEINRDFLCVWLVRGMMAVGVEFRLPSLFFFVSTFYNTKLERELESLQSFLGGKKRGSRVCKFPTDTYGDNEEFFVPW